jgi:type I restriction enzyme S subunit
MSGAVPKLRFDGFAGEWTNIPLSNLISALDAGVSVNSGDRPAFAFEKSVLKTSCVTFGRFDLEENKVVEDPNEITRLKEAVSKNTVIISRMNTPQLVGANAFVAEDAPTAFLPDRLWAAKISAKADPSWVGHLLAHPVTRASFSDRATGTSGTMKNLTKDAVLTLEVIAPTLPEQQKIAAFLGAMDGRLAGLRQTEAALMRFKAGLMQRLFSQKLRFRQDDGSAFPDWDVRELQEIGQRCKAKNTELELSRVLTNSAAMGVVDQGDYFDKEIANVANIGGYYIVRAGDFVYNPRISVTAPVGPIKRNTLGDGIMSPLYTVFRINEGDIEFFAQYFASNFWHDHMKSIANYGARHDRMAISTADFMSLPLPYPHPDEQRKIAAALSALDAKIAATALQITQTERFKQGLLQQMFV